MPKFVLLETIIREYEVEAEDRDEALNKVMNDETLDYSEESQGIVQVIDISTNHETIF